MSRLIGVSPARQSGKMLAWEQQARVPLAGHEVTAVWHDEAATITGRMVGPPMPQTQKMARHGAAFVAGVPVFPRIVRPQQIACRYCGAQPGQECQRWRRTKRGKVKQNRDSPHPNRRYDARLATAALNALTRR
jgi:hypothetical protein